MPKFVRGLLWVGATVAVILLLLRAFVLTVWDVPNEPRIAAAVAPTLEGGDTVVVMTVGTPSFGELVRCKDPEDPTKFVIEDTFD